MWPCRAPRDRSARRFLKSLSSLLAEPMLSGTARFRRRGLRTSRPLLRTCLYTGSIRCCPARLRLADPYCFAIAQPFSAGTRRGRHIIRRNLPRGGQCLRFRPHPHRVLNHRSGLRRRRHSARWHRQLDCHARSTRSATESSESCRGTRGGARRGRYHHRRSRH